MDPQDAEAAEEPLLRVMSLHALTYCERLFYLEEVEELRVADKAVFDGRRAHEEMDEGELASFTLEAPALGVRGRLDALRRRDGGLIPMEFKKGHAARGTGAEAAWRTDQIQVAAYAMVLEEALGEPIAEGRVRYLGDRKTVRVPVDAALRQAVRDSIARARRLRLEVVRPPVTDNERLCPRCSLAPVCLPEEERAARDGGRAAERLFPKHQDRMVVHVVDHGTRVGRKGNQLALQPREGTEQKEEVVPIEQVSAVVIHGYGQISTQALRLCADHEVGVQWISGAGEVMAALTPGPTSAQRHLRQFAALQDEGTRLRLARILVMAKVEMQLAYLLRGSRGEERSAEMRAAIDGMRDSVRRVPQATGVDELLGLEGAAAASYFSGFGRLLRDGLDERLRFMKRTRRPTTDRCNALLNFGYGMLFRECVAALVAVGLHPGVGFYHKPRTAAPPLALDLMELFRVPMVDMAVVGALNRDTFDADSDFEQRGAQVWMTPTGKAKAIELFERRKRDEWRHSVLDYSLSYARMVELEARLLEKEWSGEGQLFARFRLR